MKNSKSKQILTKDDDLFDEFIGLLYGPEGIDFQKKPSGSFTWKCNRDFTFTINILEKHFSQIDIEGTLEYFGENGGHCDCEIILNVSKIVKSMIFLGLGKEEMN